MELINPFNYSEFIGWVEKLVDSKLTSGNNQNEKLIEFTKLNFFRMNRLYKTINIEETLTIEIDSLVEAQKWVIITEAWCGDSAQILPILAKISSSSNNKIELQIILRDLNPKTMDKYLTNGSKSIPKLIAFDNNGNEIFTWGPRPAQAQKLFNAWKQSNDLTWDEFEIQLHKCYTQDKGLSIQNEILKKLKLLQIVSSNTIINN